MGRTTFFFDGTYYIQVISVNTNGVFYTAQAAGRQMSRFGNGGSIILIASMSGSITNKVRCFITRYNPGWHKYLCARWKWLTNGPEHSRITRRCLTTRANRQYCRWHGVWRASWVRRAYGSTLSLPGTFTLREYYFFRRFGSNKVRSGEPEPSPGYGRLHAGVLRHHSAVMSCRELTNGTL